MGVQCVNLRVLGFRVSGLDLKVEGLSSMVKRAPWY